MARLKTILVEGFASVFGFLRSTKEAYDGAPRFARMRLLILGLLIVDVFAVIVFMSTMGSRDLDVTVWFEKSFPSNMLVVRNESGDPLDDVRLTLDGRFVLVVPRLEVGVRGFEVSHDFVDTDELTPDDDYLPRVVVVEADGETMSLDVSAKPNR